MTNRFAKSFAAVAAIAVLAVPAAQAKNGADDPPGHEHQGVVAAVGQAAAKKAAVKKHKVRHRHRHGARHLRRADDGSGARRADDNSSLRRSRGADDNAPRGGGADDPAGHR
jgi:opacity protein-like surface antigen